MELSKRKNNAQLLDTFIMFSISNQRRMESQLEMHYQTFFGNYRGKVT